MADQNQTTNNSASTGSPWDEPLDIPEEKEKKEVVGTLEDSPSTSDGETKADSKPVPFNIPEGIDDEKVGKKIPAEEIVEKEKNKLKLTPQKQSESPSSGKESKPSMPVAKIDPAGKPLEKAKESKNLKNEEIKNQSSQSAMTADKPIPAQPTVDNIVKPKVESAIQRPSSGHNQSQLETQSRVDNTAKDQSETNKIKENIASSNTQISVEPNKSMSTPEASPRQQEKMATNQRKPKSGFLSKINPFSKNKNPKPAEYASPLPVSPKPKKPRVVTPQAKPQKQKARRKPIKIDFHRKPGFIGAVSIVLIFVSLTFLTENGLVSLGIEKIYGIVGLEQLWGGLPRNPEAALSKSFVKGRENIEFKAKGEITMTVDKTINSSITSPLVAVADFIYLARDTKVGSRTKAILAQSDYYYDDSYYEYDYGDEETSSTTDYDLNSSYDDSLDSDDPSSSIYDSSSQEDYQSYTTDTSTIKEINADFESVSTDDGTKTDFTINKVTGRSSSVSMITSQNDLYINTSSDIEYHASAEQNKWLDYSLVAPKNENVLSDIYSLKTDNGFSIIGRRISNEKVSSLRCYRYQIDSLEIGSSLEFLGIESELVQKISGDVWIGIKDQLIHKIDVTIIPSISSSVSRIDLKVEFYDYGASNSIEIPRLDQKIAVSADDQVDESEETTVEKDEEEGISSTESSRDDTRKSDLAKVKSALEEYYDDNGYYPVSSDWSSINKSTSILVTKLVPEYLSATPTDPKSSEGYYYGYKSDGKSYTLSARFENLNDPEITNVGGDIWLHYVYSDN